MLQKPTQIIRVVSLPEKQYDLGGTIPALLAPSIVIAFMRSSFDSNDNDARVGLEVHSADGKTLCRKFWEIQPPVKLRQAIRSLKLLEMCSRIEDDTLCACYYAASRNLDETTRRYICSLKHGGFTNIESCREQILKDANEDDLELKKLANLLAGNNISYDSND